MIRKFLHFIGAKCDHRNMSRVFNDHDAHENYVVCLDCGREYTYNWGEMKIGKERLKTWHVQNARPVVAEAPKRTR